MIEDVPAANYRRWLDTLDTKPTVRVHRALVQWPDGINRSTHIKLAMATPGLPSRHLINEGIGWLLAHAAGLPVPGKAGYMILTSEQVRTAHADVECPDGALAWLCSTEPNPGLLLSPRDAERMLVRELKDWRHTGAAIALDEWLANTDRNCGNLIRRGPGDFVLIDHDNILTGAHWLEDALADARTGDFENLLMSRMETELGRSSDAFRRMVNAIHFPAEAFPEQLAGLIDDLRRWLETLLDEDEARCSAEGFIAYRSSTVANTIRRRYQLLT